MKFSVTFNEALGLWSVDRAAFPSFDKAAAHLRNAVKVVPDSQPWSKPITHAARPRSAALIDEVAYEIREGRVVRCGTALRTKHVELGDLVI